MKQRLTRRAFQNLAVHRAARVLVMAFVLATISLTTWAHHDPNTNFCAGPSIAIEVFRSDNGSPGVPIAGESTILECENIFYRVRLSPFPGCVAIERGTLTLMLPDGTPVNLTPTEGIPCIGGLTDDVNSATNDDRGLCLGSDPVFFSGFVPFDIGLLGPPFAGEAIVSAHWVAGFAHFDNDDEPNQGAETEISTPITVCPENTNECAEGPFCDPATAAQGVDVACSYPPLDASTDCTDTDGNQCTFAGCDGAGVCVQDHNVTECPDDGNPCTDDPFCETTTGQCEYPPLDQSTDCPDTDGNQCTFAGCDGAGVCVQDHNETECPDDGNPCTDDPFCETTSGECIYPPLDQSTDCPDTDGNQCTFAGCDGAGVCVQDHNETECPDDGNPCTDDPFCEPATGECEYPPLDQSTDCPDTDGNQCTFAGCDGAGVCVQDHNETECPDDGNPCTDDPFCEPATGECEYPPLDQSTDCPDTDGNQCTFAGCDGAGVCVQDHNVTECPDDGNPCTDDPFCEPATGECEYPPLDQSTDCPDTDGNQCTFAGCDGAGVCVQDHNETECPDDGNPCTDDPFCETTSGECVYPPLDQSTDCPDTDGNFCTFAGCDGAGVCVQDHNVTECPDDGNPCTDDPFCETTSGECVYPPLDQSTDCPDTDGDLCTFAGCDGAGVCVQDHNVTECPDDGNPCTDDPFCEPATGECEYPPLDQSTDCPDTDGNQCTFAGCDGAGVCVQDHNETECPDDGNPCTDDPFCETTSGECIYPPLDQSTDCPDTDGNQCTFAGCDGAGVCVQDHNETECPDDGNPCTDDPFCEPTSGQCEYPPLDQSTDCPDTDGNQCTFAGCDGAGVCVQDHNETECPPDGNPCTDDPFCETTSGECVYPPLDQSTDCPDTDGNQCTFAGCDGAGVCVQDHNETECPDDGNPCTDDPFCEPTTGECESPPLDESTDCPDTDGNQCTFAGCDGAGVCVQDHNETECPDIDICLDEYCDTDTGDCLADCIAGDYPDECSVTVGDYIWNDGNADGLQDGEESGISGVVVELLDCAGNPAEDYAGNPVPGDTTDADGLYEFSVLTCDDPESFKVMVADSNFGGGVLTGYNSSPQYQDGGPPSAIDSDCGADHMTGCTDIARGTTDDTLDCGFYPPSEAICRTPGFWGSHGDITAQILKAAGDLPAPYDEPNHYGVMICGQPVTWNETPETLGDLENALEGLCVRVQGVKQRQLYRQLVAFHLNCIISSSLGDCDALLSTASACDALCASGQNDDGTVSINDCISMIDCFNNGGMYEAASGGTRADSPDTERDSRGILDLTLGGPEDDTASTTEDGTCVFLGDSCHDRDLCPSGGVGDGFCFEPPGPASTPKTCKNARKNDCTIDDCNGD